MGITFKSLDGVAFSKIHQAFTEAFSNYQEPFDHTEEELRYMLERSDCDYIHSFGAFDGDRMVGFILNAVGEWNGIKTAYDTGTGISPSHQGKGIASKLFEYVLQSFKTSGIKQYLLEVIKTNEAAVKLYKKKRFAVTREFDYYVSPVSDINLSEISKDTSYEYNECKTVDWDKINAWSDITPSWQNTKASIFRKADHFTYIRVSYNQEIIGYGIIQRHTGDIPLIVIHPDHRRKHIATRLINTLSNFSMTKTLRFMNIQCDYIPADRLFASLDMAKGKGQFEMILALDD